MSEPKKSFKHYFPDLLYYTACHQEGFALTYYSLTKTRDHISRIPLKLLMSGKAIVAGAFETEVNLFKGQKMLKCIYAAVSFLHNFI